LSNQFNNHLKFNNLPELRKEVINNFPFLKELNVLPKKEKINFGPSVEIKEKLIDYNITNFYMTDSISRSSLAMANCTKEILNKVA